MKKPQIHRHDRQLLQNFRSSHDLKLTNGLENIQSSHHFKLPSINTTPINPSKLKSPFKLPLLQNSPKGVDNFDHVRSISPMSSSSHSSSSSPRQLMMQVRALVPKVLPKIDSEALNFSARKNKQLQSPPLEKFSISPRIIEQQQQPVEFKVQPRDEIYALNIPAYINETVASSPSTQRNPVIENMYNPSFSLSKGRKKKKINKKRAALRDLTSSQVPIPKKTTTDLYVEPVTSIYNSAAEEIIKDLLGEVDEGVDSGLNFLKSKNVKQVISPEPLSFSPPNKKRPLIKKINNSQIRNISIGSIVQPVQSGQASARVEKEQQESLNKEEDLNAKNKEIVVSKLKKIVTIAPFLEMQEGNKISKSFRTNIVKSSRK